MNPAYRLHRGFRLQWEPAQQSYVLLYPEGMVQLNDSAAAILRCCDGATSAAAIIERLQHEYECDAAESADLEVDIQDFLRNACERGWLTES